MSATISTMRIAQTPERYLHSPRLVYAPDGGVQLKVIAWQSAGAQQGERVVTWQVAQDGALSAEQAGPLRAQVIALTRGDKANETDESDTELHEARGHHRVWVEHEAGIAQVWLASAGGAPQLVYRARGSVLCPSLAVAPNGVWVAFHSDVREDNLHDDVAKWITLRFVAADGVVLEPCAEMIDRDRERSTIEQSFEFPALVLGNDGALALFGRGSHNFWRQDLNAQGFRARVPLSDGEWGSRGRNVVALAVRDGIVVARRDRRGIEVDLLPHVTGGAPALRAARIDCVSSQRAAAAARVDPAAARGFHTLFGDIQQHSAHSDGVGSAHEAYLRARYRYADDFVALTDHESFLGKRTGPGEWEYLQRVAERYDEPGTFATLYAYEWTGKMYPGPGHKCVYFPERGTPLVSRDEVPEGRALVERIKQLGGFASPHHIGWTGCDEAGHDDEGQPVWEICSCHGCYEHVDHPLGQRGELREHMADTLLKRGHRFGFTASSDSHGLLWHHGEARKRDPYRTGLTAVQARSNTRQDIMDALIARRCYATSGAKILLDMSANGLPMGSELTAQSAVDVVVAAVGEGAIARIELVGATGVLHTQPFETAEARLNVRLPADRAAPFVYARVTQRDGEMAWSSPVFVGPKQHVAAPATS